MKTRLDPRVLRVLGVLGLLLAAAGCGEMLVGDECGPGLPCGPLELVNVRLDRAELHPGLYGVGAAARLRNRSTRAVAGASLRLVFRDDGGERDADFVARQVSGWDGEIEAGGEVTVTFTIDVAAGAAPTCGVVADGELRYSIDATLHATGARSPWSGCFAALNAELVVDTAVDHDEGGDGGADLSLREALRLAGERPGADRITFSAAAFPPGGSATLTLDSRLPDLPPLRGDIDPVVLIAPPGSVTIEPDHGFDASRRVAFTMYGPAVIQGLRLRQMSRLVEAGADCVVKPEPGAGAAIVVAGGTGAVIAGNHLLDAGVAERPCTSTLVAVKGGAGHFITDNVFEDSPGDAITVYTSDTVVRGNTVLRGLDEAFVVDGGAAAVRIEGNLAADLSLACLIVYAGTRVEAVNNTFARCRCYGVQAVGPAALELRNNVYVSVTYAPLIGSDDGAGISAAFEATDSDTFCDDCLATALESSSMLTGIELGLADPAGATWTALSPTSGSLLLDSGSDASDRNGSAPGRFAGDGPDRGAVELVY